MIDDKLFDLVCSKFRWIYKYVVEQHERDDCSWTIKVWYTQDGKPLFNNSDITDNFKQELALLAERIS